MISSPQFSNTMSIIFFLFLWTLPYSALADTTNAGTISSIQNGLATRCEKKDPPCYNLADVFGKGLNLATIGQCMASINEFEEAGVEVPECPQNLEDIQGLDNTYPSGGIFALYTGDNDLFLKDLITNYLNSSKGGKFNLILPKNLTEDLKSKPDLLALFNSRRVNIVPVQTTPYVDRWIQDAFQFVTVDGKPAIYHNVHTRGSYGFSCELAKNCGIPYYIPPNLTRYDDNAIEEDSGGNIEVMPGGTFLLGTRRRGGLTEIQESYKKNLESFGNRVLVINTEYTAQGHVDEKVNFVKTDKDPPCDFAVMVRNTEKGFELIERAAAEQISQEAKNPGKPQTADNPCKRYSNRNLAKATIENPVTEEDRRTMREHKCINGQTAKDFFTSDRYKRWKRSLRKQMSIVQENKKLIREELKKTTGCPDPPFIEIPVMRGVTPNSVNGVVQTPPEGASHVILPRSYFAPFDEYIKDRMAKEGIQTTYVHDMGYHLGRGDVHCGTNSARICRP